MLVFRTCHVLLIYDVWFFLGGITLGCPADDVVLGVVRYSGLQACLNIILRAIKTPILAPFGQDTLQVS